MGGNNNTELLAFKEFWLKAGGHQNSGRIQIQFFSGAGWLPIRKLRTNLNKTEGQKTELSSQAPDVARDSDGSSLALLLHMKSLKIDIGILSAKPFILIGSRSPFFTMARPDCIGMVKARPVAILSTNLQTIRIPTIHRFVRLKLGLFS